MYLAPTEDQLQIVEATRDVLLSEAPFERWFVPDADALADDARLIGLGAAMGWTGFAAPADIGGSEASAIDEMLVFRELGGRLAPLGLTAATIAAHVSHGAGNAALAAALVSGETRAGLITGQRGDVLLGAVGGVGLQVEGDRLRVLDAAGATSAGIAFDWMTPSARLDNAAVIVEVEDAGLARRLRLLIGAQAQGVAETALAQANAYAKEREQFGKPIGSFQAIRHRIADMEMLARRAEAQLRFAAVTNHDGNGDAPLQVLAALFLSLRAARNNAEANIFIHGAMGVTTENIGHLLLKRGRLWGLVAGPDRDLLDDIGASEAALL